MTWWQWLILWAVISFPVALLVGRMIRAGNPTDEDKGEP